MFSVPDIFELDSAYVIEVNHDEGYAIFEIHNDHSSAKARVKVPLGDIEFIDEKG